MDGMQATNAMNAQAEQSVAAGRTLVVGIGATGASIAAWLAREEVRAMFVDSRETPPGLDRVRELLPDADIVCGDLPTRVPEDVTELLVSPGLSMELPHAASSERLRRRARCRCDVGAPRSGASPRSE